MTKSKTSTIAIVVLSVLLAAALASTIVLAAFGFTRQATTTLTFSGGLELNVKGVTGTAWDVYAVNNEGVVGSKVTDTSALTSGVSLSAVSVSKTANKDVLVAFRVIEKSSNTADLYVGATPNETTALATDNYAAASATSVTTATVSGWTVILIPAATTTDVVLTNQINTLYSAAGIGGLQGAETAEVAIQIAAAYGSDDADGKAAITQATTDDAFNFAA